MARPARCTTAASVFVLLLLALAVVPPAHARTDRFELTPYVSYRFGGEVHDDGYYRNRNDSTDIDETEAYGITLDIPLPAGLALEFLVSRQQTSAQFDNGLFEPSTNLGDIDVTYAHVGVLYQWDVGQVVPFVVGSIGGTIFDPSFPGADSETRLSLGLGGGVKVFFAEHVGVRLEGRGFWTDFEDNGDRYHYGDDNRTLYQGEASVGLIFAW